MKRFLIVVLATVMACWHAMAGTNTVASAKVPDSGPLKELIANAEASVQKQQFDLATNQYTEIETRFPEYGAESAVRLADILLLQAKTNLAIKAYEDALKKYPHGATRCGGAEKLKKIKDVQNTPSDRTR